MKNTAEGAEEAVELAEEMLDDEGWGEEVRNTYAKLKLSFRAGSFMLSEFTIGLLSANTDCRTLLTNPCT